MTELKYVFDGTRENFQQLVVENSKKGVVLVNYWKPDAGPCFKLWEALEQLSGDYQGRFLLVNINTDTQTSLVRENGITSVPTVKIYHHGEIVESIHGPQPVSMLRETIDQFVPPAQNTAIAMAIQAYRSGHTDEALKILADAATGETDDLKLHATAIKLMLRANRYSDIESYVSVLPAALKAKPEISTLAVHARILNLAQLAPPVEQLEKRLQDAPDDLDALLMLAAVALVNDDYEAALTHLLQLVRKDRTHADGLAHRAMLVIFSLLGKRHELSRSFQHSLREVLH